VGPGLVGGPGQGAGFLDHHSGLDLGTPRQVVAITA
jgi:hypothetical protein